MANNRSSKHQGVWPLGRTCRNPSCWHVKSRYWHMGTARVNVMNSFFMSTLVYTFYWLLKEIVYISIVQSMVSWKWVCTCHINPCPVVLLKESFCALGTHAAMCNILNLGNCSWFLWFCRNATRDRFNVDENFAAYRFHWCESTNFTKGEYVMPERT